MYSKALGAEAQSMKGPTGPPLLFLWIVILHNISPEVKGVMLLLRGLKFTSAEDF